MTRRTLLASLTALIGAAASPPRSQMGVASTSFMTVRRPKDTLEFLAYCNSLGAGGIQASLASLEAPYLASLRKQAEANGMYLEVMSPLPSPTDSTRFEAIVKGAKQAGALCLRAACLSGRRYETFASLDEWKAFVARSMEALRTAAKIVERERMPLAIENHKDWTLEEFEGILRDYSSEYIGVCLDTGNNMSLLDEPHQFVAALASYAISTHIKDMGLQDYPNGFLLAEVPLGEGVLQLKQIVETIRRARPATRFTLEMITRDPLEVPCLTDKYWVTMPASRGPAMARMLRQARQQQRELPRLSTLPAGSRATWEEENVKQCLAYSRSVLGV